VPEGIGPGRSRTATAAKNRNFAATGKFPPNPEPDRLKLFAKPRQTPTRRKVCVRAAKRYNFTRGLGVHPPNEKSTQAKAGSYLNNLRRFDRTVLRYRLIDECSEPPVAARIPVSTSGANFSETILFASLTAPVPPRQSFKSRSAITC
jgi:hypothetical protein